MKRKHLVGLFVLMMLIPAIIWHAFVTVQLWAWFVASQFGLPYLTLPQAIGLGLIVATFTTSFARRGSSSTLESDADKLANVFSYLFIIPLFLLSYGWVVTWFM